MLETIRQYARERLEEAGEAAELGRRHAQFFLARAEAADPFLPVHAEGWQERLAEGVGHRPAPAGWVGPEPPAVAGHPPFWPPPPRPLVRRGAHRPTPRRHRTAPGPSRRPRPP